MRSSTFLFVGLDFYLLVLNLEAETVVNAHVLIGHPDESEEGNKVSPPVDVQQLVMNDEQHSCRDVVTETIFASKQVKELAADEGLRSYTFFLAVLSRLAKYFFMRNSPRNTGDWDAQYQKPRDLQA